LKASLFCLQIIILFIYETSQLISRTSAAIEWMIELSLVAINRLKKTFFTFKVFQRIVQFLLNVFNKRVITVGMPSECTSGTNVIKLFCPQFINFRNKLKCLFLAGFSSSLWVMPGAYPRVEHLEGSGFTCKH
jgi:hypothetical protein